MPTPYRVPIDSPIAGRELERKKQGKKGRGVVRLIHANNRYVRVICVDQQQAKAGMKSMICPSVVFLTSFNHRALSQQTKSETNTSASAPLVLPV